MEITTINAEVLAKMFLAGAKNLEAKKEWINELNVFPVPDGDTGTNMSMTIMSAAKEVSALGNPDMAALAKAISSGSLRGARGNSGVILSQLFRGFTKVIAEYDEIDVQILCDALQKKVEPIFGPERVGDIKHSNADISKARKLLGYEPEFDFGMGIKLAIEWYKENL